MLDLRALQRPLKQRYRERPEEALITLRAVARQQDSPLRCMVETTGGTIVSEAHPGVGGPGTASCSGDLLLPAFCRVRADHLPNGRDRARHPAHASERDSRG
jgi:hypothetical protein